VDQESYRICRLGLPTDSASLRRFVRLVLVVLCFAFVGCEASGDSADDEGSGDDTEAGDGDDDVADDDDDSAPADDDDDSTPDPEDPFPGDSIHMGQYEGLVVVQGVEGSAGIDLCNGTMSYVVDAEGLLTGEGSCEWSAGSQGDSGVPVVSFQLGARFVDVGNMYGWKDEDGKHGPNVRQTYSWAPNEANDYLLDGTVSQGGLELVWGGNDWMPTPDGEIQFQASANGQLVAP